MEAIRFIKENLQYGDIEKICKLCGNISRTTYENAMKHTGDPTEHWTDAERRVVEQGLAYVKEAVAERERIHAEFERRVAL
jgi:hypothetical protein